jgi:hypothetical protein
LEERGRERRLLFSANLLDLRARAHGAGSARTEAKRIGVGLLSPALSSKGGEGVACYLKPHAGFGSSPATLRE